MANQLEARRGVVVTIRAEAAAAGMAALKSGGNAVDAAVAAAMVLCVISPTNVGFGGYGGTMAFYEAKAGRVHALDFDSRAPLAYRDEAYKDAKVASHGYLAVGVPAVVAGFDAAMKRFGTQKWKDVSAHAASLADEGFAVDAILVTALKSFAATGDRESVDAIIGERGVPKAGEKWRQPDLARLIRSLDADPRAFYTGEIAKQIVGQVQANGGLLSEEDLARYEAEVVEPLHIRYRGHELFTPPPPSGGITSLSILKTLEEFDIPTYDRWGGPYFELFAGAAMLCWQDRARWLGDPQFVKVPMEEMLSAKAAAVRAERIRHGDTAPRADQPALPPSGEHTVNVATVDAQGNAVSLTVTHGESFGARVAIGGLGLFLGHGMSRFDYKQSPNAPQPGKRMQHNMCPLMVLKDNKLRHVIGLPGGPKIVTVTAQLAISVIDFGATPGDAVSAPRVHVETQEPILVGATVPFEVAAEMVLMGHNVKGVPSIGGAANVVTIGPADGAMTAACSAGPNGVAGF